MKLTKTKVFYELLWDWVSVADSIFILDCKSKLVSLKLLHILEVQSIRSVYNWLLFFFNQP